MSKGLYLFPLSDLHLGSKQCDLVFFDYWRREFEKAPENKAIYLLGDMLEFPTTRIDAYDSVMSTYVEEPKKKGILDEVKSWMKGE